MNVSIQLPAIIGAVTFLLVSGFQVLLVCGLPLAAYSWGGKYEGVLPPRLRMASLVSAGLLLLMAFVLLVHANVLFHETFLPTKILVWVITLFMGLNTLGNLASKNKKEKLVMTPLTGIAFVCCLLVAIFS